MDAAGRDGHGQVALRVAGDSTYCVAFPAVLLAFTVDDERLRIA
jgi:hypothetical protein